MKRGVRERVLTIMKGEEKPMLAFDSVHPKSQYPFIY